MNDRMNCRNACLVDIVLIRRDCRKLLNVRGSGLTSDLDGCVTAAVLNINHSLNSIERELEKCRSKGGASNAEIQPDKSVTLGNL